MCEHRIEPRHSLAEIAFGKIAERQIAERHGAVALQLRVLFLVAADEPVAVQPDLKKTVPIDDVVAVTVLNRQNGAFDIRRVGVDIQEMDTGQIASAAQKNLAVVKGQLPYPLQKRQSVRAFRGVRDPVALAASAPPAMLRNPDIAVRGPPLTGERLGLDPLVFDIRVALDDNRALHAVRRHGTIRVQLHAIRHGYHLFEITGLGAIRTNRLDHPVRLHGATEPSPAG